MYMTRRLLFIGLGSLLFGCRASEVDTMSTARPRAPAAPEFTRAEIDAMLERGELDMCSRDLDEDGADDLVAYSRDGVVLKRVVARHRRTEPVPGFEDVSDLGITRIERRDWLRLYFLVRDPDLIQEILRALNQDSIRVVSSSTWYRATDNMRGGGHHSVDNCDNSLYFYRGNELYRKLHLGVDLRTVEGPAADRPGMCLAGRRAWLSEIHRTESDAFVRPTG